STVIFAPMSQFGCLSACAGLAARNCSRLHSRNGPPLAVSVIERTSSTRPAWRHWKIALCSLSVGSSVAPWRSTAAIITSPAETSASLLASATTPPCSIAAMVGAKPAQPTIAETVTSAPRAAASTSAAAPPAASTPLPASASRKAGRQDSSATTASSAPNSRASAASSAAWQLAVSATTRHSARARRTRSSVEAPIEPVAPRIVIERIALRRHPRSDEPGDQHDGDQAVDAIEHATVTRNEARRVLHPGAALEPALEEVPALRHDREPGAERHRATDVLRRESQAQLEAWPCQRRVHRPDPQEYPGDGSG